MSYATTADVKRVLQGSENGEGTAASLLDDSIALEITNAQAQIDATLSQVYRVPFNPVPVLIKTLAIDIAAYLCDLNYRESREYESDNYPIIRRYNRARELLEWLRNGTMVIPNYRQDGEIGSAEVIHMYEPRLMTEEDVFGPFVRDW